MELITFFFSVGEKENQNLKKEKMRNNKSVHK